MSTESARLTPGLRGTDCGETPRAIVLAAGRGTRLRPLTTQLAKPAIPFLERPLIHYSLDLLRKGGIGEICVNLHHLPETVRRAADSWSAASVRIHYSEEPEILGTGGAIRQVASFLGAKDCFAAINGKIYFEQELQPVLQAHRAGGAMVTLVLIPHSGEEPFNPVLLDPEGRVTGFALRREVTDFSQAFVYTGLQIISRSLLDRIPPGYRDTVRDVYPELIKRGLIMGYISTSFWCENSTPRRYLENCFRVARRLARHDSQADEPELSLLHGRKFKAGVGSRFSQVVAWNNVEVGAGTSLSNAILCQGCRVPPRVDLQNVVITPPEIQCPDLPEPRSLGSCLVWALE